MATFNMLVFYKHDDVLENYLYKFSFGGEIFFDNNFSIVRLFTGVEYYSDGVVIICQKGEISANRVRGHKANFIAVEEELTWRPDWLEILNYGLNPILRSPIPVQIFDSIEYEDSEWFEKEKNYETI